MNEKVRWAMRILSFVFTAAICVTAFVNSADNGERSAEKSTAVTGAVAPLVIKDYEKMNDVQKKVSEAQLNPKIRKIAHCLEFMAIGCGAAIFALTFWRLDTAAAEGKERKRKKRAPGREALCAFALLYSLLFASADEIHQYFIPGRAGMAEDVLLDFLAASVSVLIVWGVSRCAEKPLEDGA